MVEIIHKHVGLVVGRDAPKFVVLFCALRDVCSFATIVKQHQICILNVTYLRLLSVLQVSRSSLDPLLSVSLDMALSCTFPR